METVQNFHAIGGMIFCCNCSHFGRGSLRLKFSSSGKTRIAQFCLQVGVHNKKLKRRTADSEKQASEMMVSWDVFHFCFDEYEGRRMSSAIKLIDNEGSQSGLSATVMESVRLIPQKVLCDITKLGSQNNFLH